MGKVSSAKVKTRNGSPETSNRTKIGTGKTLHLNGNGRSLKARRFKELVEELGRGITNNDVEAMGFVRCCATLSMQLEDLEAKMTTGQEIDPVLYGMLVDRRLRASRALHRDYASEEKEQKQRPLDLTRLSDEDLSLLQSIVRKTATKDEEQPTKDAQPSITVQAPPPAPTVMTRPAPPPFDHMSRMTKPRPQPKAEKQEPEVIVDHTYASRLARAL